MNDTAELTLEEWLISTQERRDELDAYAKAPLPADTTERHHDMNTAIQNFDDAGRLLADAESFLTQAEAQAVFLVREEHGELTADERKKVVKNRVRTIQRIVDGLSVTRGSINSRIFSSMNANRAR